MPYNRLLVIDDEPDVAATLGKVARRAGFDTIVTTDGADFLDRAKAWEPTVMVLDLTMPEPSGREILAELARWSCQARILIVSGRDEASLAEVLVDGRSQGLNIAGMLRKPLRMDSLREALRGIYDEAEVLSGEDAISGIQKGEFFLEYQPKIDLTTLQPVGVESLARWRHPRHGLIPPNTFVPILEASRAMDQFTPHVIGLVVAQMKAWRAGGMDLGVAVNVSGGCVGRLPLDDIIASQCAGKDVDPAKLTLEITETAAMGDLGHAAACLDRLKVLGVRISIDDFGTGYSSMVQLRRLPFSEIKIDRSFVMDCDVDRENQIIVGAIVNLAHNLGLQVVAEGVETLAVQAYLADCGCDIGQGHLFSRPLASASLIRWLGSGGKGAAAGPDEGRTDP